MIFSRKLCKSSNLAHQTQAEHSFAGFKIGCLYVSVFKPESREQLRYNSVRTVRRVVNKADQSKRNYRKALKEIERLMDARPNTPNGDRLDVLVTLVEAWEEKHWPIDLPDPVEAILFAMEHRGLSRRDLEPLIGSRARVAEVLNHKRQLTLPMIRRLHERLGIPADVLIGQSAAA